jgi:hypothetical protein
LILCHSSHRSSFRDALIGSYSHRTQKRQGSGEAWRSS